MIISFLLPRLIKIPSGGIKVIYKHAESLAGYGHKARIISPIYSGINFKARLLKIATDFRDFLHKVPAKPYYNTPKGVEHLIIPEPNEQYIPDGDVIIATAWNTAGWVNNLPDSKGTKFYFVQGLEETYLGGENSVLNTWKLPLKKIVVAGWLKDKIHDIGETTIGVIPNAINPDDFYKTKSLSSRNRTICMSYHPLPKKNVALGINILIQVKKLYPDLQATIFSARPIRHNVPSWINIEIRPTLSRLRDIYNESTVFLSPSEREGWPLPPMEAMACGCVVVAVENQGIKEYITDGVSGLLASKNNIQKLCDHIKNVFESPVLRKNIVNEGMKQVASFNWDKICRDFEKLLRENK